MPARIEGYISIDVSEFADELEIHADADDIAEIMDANNIDMDEMMEYFDITPEIMLTDIKRYIEDVCDHQDLIKIVNCCMSRFTSDYNATFNQMVDNKREADQAKAEIKVMTGGPHVSEIRPSS
jgi:hypothetical protein